MKTIRKKSSKNQAKVSTHSEFTANGNNSNEKSNFEYITQYGSLLLGIILAIYIGRYYADYANLLHENNLWFSNIKEVEREISFRTEAGLYYSYYKQLVKAPSFHQGLWELIHDNKTEHLRTINILERFNIYQEVFLASIYRSLPTSITKSLKPIIFYVNSVFALHGVYMVALFLCAWLLSGSILAGALTNAFFIFNRVDMTRVSYTVPLRESYSLPFIFLQIVSTTYYFRKDISVRTQNLCLLVMSIFTLCFVATWQFAQFVVLLESFAVFGAHILGFLPTRKARGVFLIFLLNLAFVCGLQFGNDMLYTSLAGSFCFAALIVLSLKERFLNARGFLMKLILLAVEIVLVFLLTFAINISIKKLSHVDSDEHVFRFVSIKLGFGDAMKTDFDVKLYLCNGGFQFLPWDTFERLTDGLLFPLYAISMLGFFVMLLVAYIQKLHGVESFLDDSPELVFNGITNVFFGIMAMTTLRMKFLWFPHMAIMASAFFFHLKIWKTCLHALHIGDVLNFILRHSAPIIIIGMLLAKKLPEHNEEATKLMEFYDPDTVELMEWINANTLPEESFTGSMQLLAGVKLCTKRPITNHPHYENKFLRDRTQEVYQIYAKRRPKDVYNILKKHGTSYIILENSICYSQQEKGCALKDILDMVNDDKYDNTVPRFCHYIKSGHSSFKKYFRKVFENRTFYLYKLL